ncbi:nuclear transport factor 2 family protein [Streptomyces sp. NPDC058369]|uniref:nuclear transport factor 2 family protein n=1 Tax=unclassified Streptomyces TaxID=2593676 RepID=UPI0034566D81
MSDHDDVRLLTERVGRLQIRADLTDLADRYGHLLDDRDWHGITSCFTRDGRLKFQGGEVTGREQLYAFYRAQLPKNEFTFHYRHSHVLTIIDDERATGVVSAHAEHARNGTCVLAAVRYYDDYVKEDGVWRLACREIRSRYCLGWLDMASDFHEGAHSPLMRDTGPRPEGPNPSS